MNFSSKPKKRRSKGDKSPIGGAVIQMILSQLEHPASEKYGTYDLCGQGGTRWYDYAQFILAEISFASGCTPTSQSHQFKAPSRKNAGVADRPLYATLSCEKIKSVFGVSQQNWKEPVRAVVKQLIQGS